MKLLSWVIPEWAIWLVIAGVALALYGLGRYDGKRIEGAAFSEYKAKVAMADTKVLQARTMVLHELEIRYLPARDRIITRTETIIKEVPTYVTQADNDKCTVNNGFVRVYNAGWEGVDPPAASDSDRGPSGVPLSEVAEVDAHNAGACHLWREQALALRKAYNLVREAKP